MKQSYLMRPLALAMFCVFGCAALAARADTPPLRQLVYSFSYEASQNGAVTNDPGSTGRRDYSGSLGDKGTMTVDVLKEAADHGLVVVVSEQGQDTRRGAPVKCAVYGNTNVFCDPNVTVTNEEYTLLRFLGANFIDPNQIDAKQHWAVSQTSGPTSLTADYTIKTNDNGVMTIEEKRHIKNTSEGTTTSDIETQLDYNFNRLLPTSISEYSIVRRQGGTEDTAETTYQTTFHLLSDSMAKQ